MRILFLGTPDFAIPSLEEVAKEWEVVGVITQPDRPSGRGLKPKEPPVKRKALELGLKVYQTASKGEVLEIARDLKPDCAVVVAFGMILPQEFLKIPPLGAVNLHASLLPKLRGPDPIRRAILVGEEVTGNTVMLINERMDAGDILAQEEVRIEPADNAVTLTERLSLLGSHLLVRTLEEWFDGRITPVPQKEEDATYAPVMTREEMRICWKAHAQAVCWRVRASYPEGYFYFRGKEIKVLEVEAIDGCGEPGEVLDEREMVVACGEGAVRILKIRTPKGKVVSGEEFARGYRPERGELLK